MNYALTKETATPLAVGAITAGGIMLYRSATGISSPIPLGGLVMVAGSSAVASFVSPYLTKMVLPEESTKGMLLNLALSTALTWTYLTTAVDMQTANATVPIQIASQLAGGYVGKKVAMKSRETSELSDEVIRDLGGETPRTQPYGN